MLNYDILYLINEHICDIYKYFFFLFSALIATFGDINAAVERLLSNGQVSMS